MIDRRYTALACPVCGASPQPDGNLCPGCGRRMRLPSGVLDLLPAGVGEEADRFAAEYRSLRTEEGWVGAYGREDPAAGRPRLWRGRAQAVKRAAAIVRDRLGAAPLILDVGSGGGWAAGMLGGAQVIAIDLIEASVEHGLAVRGDMRRLPVRDGAADGALYAASLHYAPVDLAVREAGRVLRPGGLLIALDSPLYEGAGEVARAEVRSKDYYARAGHPALSARYHPIEIGRLRQELTTAGFRLDRLVVRPAWWRRLRPGPASLVVASRVR